MILRQMGVVFVFNHKTRTQDTGYWNRGLNSFEENMKRRCMDTTVISAAN
jgi:hypothetical protein